MQRQAWERALARAVTDVRFQVRLLTNPGETLLDYGLDLSELPLLKLSTGAATLGQLAGHLLHLAATRWSEHAYDPLWEQGPEVHPSERWVGHPFDRPTDRSWAQRRTDAFVRKDAPPAQGRPAAPIQLSGPNSRPPVQRLHDGRAECHLHLVSSGPPPCESCDIVEETSA